VEVASKEKIEALVITSNKKNTSQGKNTPFMQEPLVSEVG
jgi:hypothetical protein